MVMDTFYSRLAAEVEDESDETQSVASKSKTTYKTPEISGDIDDLLDELDFTSKPKESKKTTGNLDFDSLVIPEQKKTADPPNLKENQSLSSSFSDGSAKPAKSKRNILDSLLSFDDSVDLGGGDSGEVCPQENTSHEPLATEVTIKETDAKSGSKRSVRFLEELGELNDSNVAGSFSSGELKTSSRSDLNVEPPTVRPQTAPQQGRNSGGLENSLDFNDDFDWTSRKSRSRNEFRTDLQRAVSGLSLHTEDQNPKTGDKSPIGETSTPKNTNSLVTGTSRRPATARGAVKEKSPVNETRKSSSVIPTLYDTPSLTQFVNSTPKDSPDPTEAKLAQRIKHLEVELDGAKKLLQMAKRYHQEEIKLLEESHASKVRLLEENSARREKHLKEEMEFSIGQFRDRITQMEQYHETLRTELVTTVAASKSDATRTVESLRAEHSAEMEALLTKNQQALANLRQATLEESKTISELQPSAQSLRDLLEQLVRAAGDLQKGEDERQVAAAQRIGQLERREEALRQAEERLRVREKDLESAHHCLTEQVAKLEVQLREQSKLLADDRWLLKQEQGRLTKLQVTLEEDRRSIMEQSERERSELQQLMSTFFSEHRETQTRLTAERNSVLDQQQRLRADQMSWQKRQEEEEARINKMKEETTAAKEAFQMELRTLDERMHQIRVNEVKLGETQRHLDIIRNDLANKETAVTEKMAELDLREQDLATRLGTLNGMQTAVAEVDARCRRLQEEQTRTQTELTAQRKEVEETERRLAQEKQELERREEEFEKKLRAERKLVCSRCKQPVKKVPNRIATNGRSKHDQSSDDEQLTTKNGRTKFRWAQARNPDVLQATMQAALDVEPEAVKLVDDISNEYSRVRVLEQLRQELVKDANFLEDEKVFLNGLQHSPYATDPSPHRLT
ncbi:hypothetical protein AAHC03_016523 [Spirometra sp. Aus1]